MTFTAQAIICALIVGLLVGATIGAICWDLLVTDRVRRQRDVAEARRRAYMVRAETASIRADAYALMLRTSVVGHRVLDDNDRHSRKATPLEVVR